LPAMTNYTVCVLYQTYASNADSGDASTVYGNLAEVRSTADGSLSMIMPPSYYDGMKVVSSVGTNVIYSSNIGSGGGNQTNLIGKLCSGGFTYQIPTTEGFVCFSYSNGVMTAGCDGNVAMFNFIGAQKTNVFHSWTNSSPVNQLLVGGGDTNWLQINPVNTTNAYALTVMNVMVFNGVLGTNQYAAAYRMATDLEPYNEAVEFAGSSILGLVVAAWNPGTQGMPETNLITYLDMLAHPNRLVISSAVGNSRVANWSNSGNGIPYIPSILYLNPSKYAVQAFKTDGPRNDWLAGGSIPVGIANLAPYVNMLRTNRTSFDLFLDHADYTQPLVNNLNMVSGFLAASAALPISHLYNEFSLVSSNALALASRDNPPEHPDAISPAGAAFNTMMMDVINGSPSTFESPYATVQSGGLVEDSDITSMNQMGFVVQSPNGSKRLTFDLSAGTNIQNIASATNGIFWYWDPAFSYMHWTHNVIMDSSHAASIITGQNAATIASYQLEGSDSAYNWIADQYGLGLYLNSAGYGYLAGLSYGPNAITNKGGYTYTNAAIYPHVTNGIATWTTTP